MARWPVLPGPAASNELLWLPVQRRHNRFDLWANFCRLSAAPGCCWRWPGCVQGLGPLRTLLQALLFGLLLSLLMGVDAEPAAAACAPRAMTGCSTAPARWSARWWRCCCAPGRAGALAAPGATWIFVPHGTLGLALLSWPIGLFFRHRCRLPPARYAGAAAGRAGCPGRHGAPLHRWIPLPDPVGALEPGTEVSGDRARAAGALRGQLRDAAAGAPPHPDAGAAAAGGVGATALSTLLNFGPEHAMSLADAAGAAGPAGRAGSGAGAFAPRRLVAALVWWRRRR